MRLRTASEPHIERHRTRRAAIQCRNESRRANATMYGLSGSVWSRDTDRAVDLASRLECGTAWVNQHLAIGPLAPFGGFKHSGIGRENGPHGLSSFVELQTVQIAK